MDEGTARIELRRRSGPSLWAIIDEADRERVEQYRWHALRHGRRTYVKATIQRDGRRADIYLHRFLLHAPAGAQVDHVDHDGLNNRRSNLRLADHVSNGGNARLRVDNPSGYKGVRAYKTGWRACIVVFGERIWLGTHRTPEDAGRAYDAAARVYFGEFACLNFPREDAA